jgi:predicted GNAT family N-acyltransferase
VILIQSWHDAESEAFSIRKLVFIEEQGVPKEMELDEHDPVAWHALAYLDSQCIGTARLVILKDGVGGIGGIGRIGRMAVLPKYRKQGHGVRLLNALLDQGKAKGITQFELHAQLSAIAFYELFGFIAQGAIYDEAGIAHRDMILSI